MIKNNASPDQVAPASNSRQLSPGPNGEADNPVCPAANNSRQLPLGPNGAMQPGPVLLSTGALSHVPQQSKLAILLGVVIAQFGERAGFTRRINWMFNAAEVDYLQVNYLNAKDHEQSTYYWVEVKDGKVI